MVTSQQSPSPGPKLIRDTFSANLQNTGPQPQVRQLGVTGTCTLPPQPTCCALQARHPPRYHHPEPQPRLQGWAAKRGRACSPDTLIPSAHVPQLPLMCSLLVELCLLAPFPVHCHPGTPVQAVLCRAHWGSPGSWLNPTLSSPPRCPSFQEAPLPPSLACVPLSSLPRGTQTSGPDQSQGKPASRPLARPP